MSTQNPELKTNNKKMKIYNCDGLILGRVASQIAKAALLGEEVAVVNCEKAVISGKKTNTFQYHKQRRERRGYPLKSTKISRLPERFVRRTIRGMLPWKQNRGKEAFKRIKCYRGVPEKLADQEQIIIKEASLQKLPSLKYIRIGDLCTSLGGKA